MVETKHKCTKELIVTIKEILDSLTQAQRKEFDEDIENLVMRVGIEYDFDSQKVAEVNTNIRLKDGIYFNVSVTFHVDEHREVRGQITGLKRYAHADEYWAAVNAAKTPPDGFKNVKP